jgi:hypothetical protein
MATFLAYIEPVMGRLYPLIPTLQELAGRGHRVTVSGGRCPRTTRRSSRSTMIRR